MAISRSNKTAQGKATKVKTVWVEGTCYESADFGKTWTDQYGNVASLVQDGAAWVLTAAVAETAKADEICFEKTTTTKKGDKVTETVAKAAGLSEINTAMADKGHHVVRSMSAGSGTYFIEYQDGRTVKLVRTVATEAEAETVEVTPMGYEVVTVAGSRQLAVWPHVKRKHPKNQYGVSCIADHTTYHSYRDGERFGPARTASEDSKPGTVGALVWQAIGETLRNGK